MTALLLTLLAAVALSPDAAHSVSTKPLARQQSQVDAGADWGRTEWGRTDWETGVALTHRRLLHGCHRSGCALDYDREQAALVLTECMKTGNVVGGGAPAACT